MNAKVAVYKTHEEAVKAIRKLAEYKFPMNEVSLLGKSEMIDDHIHLRSMDPVKNTPALVGGGAGTVAGLLSELGVFAIPGFGFLYGAGALVGTIGGLDLGVLTGGLGTLLLSAGIRKDKVVEYEAHIKGGKFMIVVNGNEEDVLRAEEILKTQGTHLLIH